MADVTQFPGKREPGDFYDPPAIRDVPQSARRAAARKATKAEPDNTGTAMFSAEETGEAAAQTVAAGQLRAFIERIDSVREAEPASFRQLYSPEHGAFHDAASYQREALSPGDRIVGPAVIVERETASVVPEGFEALVLRDFCLRVSQREIAT